MVLPVVVYGCKSWTVRKADHQRIDALELWCWRRLLIVLWTARRPVSPKGNQSWIFIGGTDSEAEAPILWPPDLKWQLIGRDSDVGKHRRQEKKGMTEDRMFGWHHQLNGYEFKQALGDCEGQGSLACYSPWGCKESDMTEQVNKNNNKQRSWLSFFT